MRNRLLVLSVALLLGALGNLAAPGRAHARPIDIEAQAELRAAPTSMRTKGGASADLGAPIVSALIALRGNPTFNFTALHSAAAGQVPVFVQFWAKTANASPDVASNYSKVGIAQILTVTVTSGFGGDGLESVTTLDDSGAATTADYYPAAEILQYSPSSATHAELRVIEHPSSGGTAVLRGWGSAADPR